MIACSLTFACGTLFKSERKNKTQLAELKHLKFIFVAWKLSMVRLS